MVRRCEVVAAFLWVFLALSIVLVAVSIAGLLASDHSGASFVGIVTSVFAVFQISIGLMITSYIKARALSSLAA